MLGAQRFGRALGIDLGADLVQPDVATFAHRRVYSRVAYNEDRLQILQLAHRRIDLGFDRSGLSLAPCPIGDEERFRVRDFHPLAHRLRREAAEDDVVRCADPRAGEHRDDNLGNHRQVDADDVAGADTASLQSIGSPLHVGQELRVSDVALLSLFAKPVVGDAIAKACFDVAVKAVVGGVELTVLEPFVERGGGIVERLCERGRPVELTCALAPPCGRVCRCFGVDRRIVQGRGFGKRGGRGERPLFQQPLQSLLEIK
ncbi:unannotated protein [freshwater metagenome]|uniref:Unannotated protein n=1 Tax=freshwater metagenome TaxID=449393 RepID=A0A6J5ZW48_9ZZZZ